MEVENIKKLYLNYKILVNGFNPKGEFSIDGFKLKHGNFIKEAFEPEKNIVSNDMKLNIETYLVSCITNNETLEFNYFESENYFEMEASNKINSKNYMKIFKNKPEILDRINHLEQKLRIKFNILILFQTSIINIYDENKSKIGSAQFSKAISCWNRLMYDISGDEFTNNSRFGLDLDKFINTDNSQFNRAVEFYNDSFESDKITNRYILIFSALESIFNLDEKYIAEKLGEYSANLLAGDESENDREKIKSDIKRLYNKRCKFIHGSKIDAIKHEDEILLRRYARMIIISYWLIILNTGESAEEILAYVKGEKKLGLSVRLGISAVTSKNFYEQQHNGIKLLEKEGIVLPSELKENLLSKTKHDFK